MKEENLTKKSNKERGREERIWGFDLWFIDTH
jgi:hypothetical protein